MKILVTGGAGFIGSHVVDAFVAAGHQVSVVDNLATGNRNWINAAARLHVVDLRSARLAEVFAAERPEVVAHLAAQAAVSLVVQGFMQQTAAGATYALLQIGVTLLVSWAIVRYLMRDTEPARAAPARPSPMA